MRQLGRYRRRSRHRFISSGVKAEVLDLQQGGDLDLQQGGKLDLQENT